MWCARAAAFFTPPRPFLGQQIWSHRRYSRKLSREIFVRKVGGHRAAGAALSKVERWSHGELEKVRRQRKAKPLRTQEEPLLDWAALSKSAINICFTLTKLC